MLMQSCCGRQWRWVTGHMCQPPGMSIAYIEQNIQPFPIICTGDYFEPMALPPEKFWCVTLLCS